MGLFSRKGKDDTVEPSDASPPVGDDADDALASDFTGRPLANPLGEDDLEALAGLDRGTRTGPDPDTFG